VAAGARSVGAIQRERLVLLAAVADADAERRLFVPHRPVPERRQRSE
jgi:hypothetical protein